MKSIADLRCEYTQDGLTESLAGLDPIELFHRWFNQAQAVGVSEPNAMSLATVSELGRPSVRIVLLKGLTESGFTFFTNYESRKGQELTRNPAAALVFWWQELERQVRVEGHVTQIPANESDDYFASRPEGSQIGACISDQSRVIPDRETLERLYDEYSKRYPSGSIPRPPHWGGYRLVPDMIEFWQGRPNRLHDRIRFRCESGKWIRVRLAP